MMTLGPSLQRTQEPNKMASKYQTYVAAVSSQLESSLRDLKSNLRNLKSSLRNVAERVFALSDDA